MRAIFWLLVPLAIGWTAFYFIGGYSTFDPNQQGMQIRNSLAAGMTYQQVFDITGNPRKYRIINRKVERIAGEEVEVFVPSAPVDFDRARVDGHMANNGLPHGFMCRFDYSNSLAFNLTFDGSGVLTNIEDAVTMADILQTKE